MSAKKHPESVQKAIAEAEREIEKRFTGRRIIPAPQVVEHAIPELDDTLYVIICSPSGEARKRLNREQLAMGVAIKGGNSDKAADAMERYNSILIAECVCWVSGAEAGQSGSDYLHELSVEAGSLGQAYYAVAEACAALLESDAKKKSATAATG